MVQWDQCCHDSLEELPELGQFELLWPLYRVLYGQREAARIKSKSKLTSARDKPNTRQAKRRGWCSIVLVLLSYAHIFYVGKQQYSRVQVKDEDTGGHLTPSKPVLRKRRTNANDGSNREANPFLEGSLRDGR